MKTFAVFVFIIAVANAQPAYFREAGSYHTAGANFGVDFPLPILPGVELRNFALPLPVPSLRQTFVNVPLPRLQYSDTVVRKPSAYRHK